LKRELQGFRHHQPACRALAAGTYVIGRLIAVAVWSELGHCRRLSRSEQVVRHAGLDVTVDASDRRRASGHLSRQGPPTLRWALFEAAMNASHRRSPDNPYYRAQAHPDDWSGGEPIRRCGCHSGANMETSAPSNWRSPSRRRALLSGHDTPPEEAHHLSQSSWPLADRSPNPRPARRHRRIRRRPDLTPACELVA